MASPTQARPAKARSANPASVLVSMTLPTRSPGFLAQREADDGSDDHSPRSPMSRAGAADPAALRKALTIEEVQHVKDLPDVMDRIHAMGIADEYLSFRERYLGWRRGESTGVAGELGYDALIRPKGWGYWYPSLQVWQWRRTLSYFIAITFFEGSIFFTISSFLWCYPEYLGDLKRSVTLWGFVGGKINFFICTYLMCLETINLSNADHGHGQTEKRKELLPSDSDASSSDDCSVFSKDEDGHERWRWSPFHVRTAITKLNALGAGPWPFWASFLYFIGVLIFAVGLVVDFMPPGTLEEEVGAMIKNVAFLIGSVLFVLGGLSECIENGVFSGCTIDQGYMGALFNTLGSFGFLVGSVIAFIPNQNYWSLMAFAVGSAIFVLGSGVMIVMWKDEQFGLTFLAVLNRLGGKNGKPVVEKVGDGVHGKAEEEKTLSLASAIFIMLYCLLACLSWYDTLICFHSIWHTTHPGRVIERTFNALLPFIFAHFMLALTAGVYRTPRVAPFHQLFIGCRYMAVFMCFNSGARFVQALQEAYCTSQGLCPATAQAMPVAPTAALLL